MGTKKKMKLPFLYQSKSLDSKLSSLASSSSSSSSSPQWPFPTCGNIKTLSFRAKDDDDDDAYRTFNSAFLESEFTPLDSFYTNISSSSRSFSTMSEDSGDPVEDSVIRGLSSDRLFFEPERSSSLLLREKEQEQKHEEEEEEEEEEVKVVAYKESELLSMDSNSPYEDFRKSMEEMVEAHGLKDWQGLEELLGCYLKINGKNNHGYIVGAFIDLLVSLSFDSTSSTSTTNNNTSTSSSSSSTTTITTTTTTTTTSSSFSNYSSPSSPLSLPSSSLTTPCLSSILDHGDDDDAKHDDGDDDDHVSS